MSPSPALLDNAVEGAASVVLDVLRLPEVSAGWTAPSALPQMSIGALACHLGRQPVIITELVSAPTSLEPLESADEHYRRAAWVHATSPDDPVNDRSRDDVDAELGPGALIERVSAALSRLRVLLSDGEVGDVVEIPWQGWALRREHFLLTRLLEMVVHTEDLAASLDLHAPEFDDLVIVPVVELLARLSLQRHGQSALVSTLSRRERPHPVWAF